MAEVSDTTSIKEDPNLIDLMEDSFMRGKSEHSELMLQKVMVSEMKKLEMIEQEHLEQFKL